MNCQKHAGEQYACPGCLYEERSALLIENERLRDLCGRNAKLLKLCLYGEATDEMIEMALAEAREKGVGA